MTDETTDVSPVIGMLLERMKSNPDDFGMVSVSARHRAGIYSESSTVLTHIGDTLSRIQHRSREDVEDNFGRGPLWFLTDIEMAMLLEGYKQMARTVFEADVIRTIMTPPDLREKSAYKQEGTIVGNLTTTGSLGLGVTASTFASNTQVQAVRAQLAAQQAQYNSYQNQGMK